MTSPKHERPMRKIVAWEYFGNNSTWGYAAKLECGHERRDLSEFREQSSHARCWVCAPEPHIESADIGVAPLEEPFDDAADPYDPYDADVERKLCDESAKDAAADRDLVDRSL